MLTIAAADGRPNDLMQTSAQTTNTTKRRIAPSPHPAMTLLLRHPPHDRERHELREERDAPAPHDRPLHLDAIGQQQHHAEYRQQQRARHAVLERRLHASLPRSGAAGRGVLRRAPRPLAPLEIRHQSTIHAVERGRRPDQHSREHPPGRRVEADGRPTAPHRGRAGSRSRTAARCRRSGRTRATRARPLIRSLGALPRGPDSLLIRAGNLGVCEIFRKRSVSAHIRESQHEIM